MGRAKQAESRGSAAGGLFPWQSVPSLLSYDDHYSSPLERGQSRERSSDFRRARALPPFRLGALLIATLLAVAVV